MEEPTGERKLDTSESKGPSRDDANLLIDVATELSSARDDAERWAVANRAAESLGARTLVVSSFAGTDLLPTWIRGSIDMDWMETYWENNLHEIDPLLLGRQRGVVPQTSRTGTIRPGEGVDPRAVLWSQGMLETGFGGHLLRGYAEAGNMMQRVVAVLTDRDHGDDPFRQSETLVSTVLGLIGIHTSAPTEHDEFLHLARGYRTLSGRERDVLSLLARGLNTGRIAEQLGLAEVTVHKHFRSAKEKMGASTREQTLALAMVRGQISL